ncbi:hypothetical protein [Staphylococcus saprophyticus]|uniref:hypothetical protein n=1 Tax=Staphylococcus saprophyticus TaxID=29385 RepID=UPI0016425201|nr:hypothetical protein [Staphylococcus saprophyticus]
MEIKRNSECDRFVEFENGYWELWGLNVVKEKEEVGEGLNVDFVLIVGDFVEDL